MFRLCGSFLTGFLIILIPLPIAVAAQARGSASVSGKVTVAGKPAKGINVTASLNSPAYSPKPSTASAITNDEGVYHIMGLAQGTYKIAPYDPANFLQGGGNPWDPPGKSITLSTDETADNIDFDIARGGVITGRISKPDGKSMIETQVSVEPVDSKVVLPNKYNNPMYQTDDRGIYRIYGLPAGQYLVSVGEDRSGNSISFGRERKGFYPRTYYPGVTEKSEAKTVELSGGAEEKNIDITLAPREKTYTISGRVIDETSGKPVPNVQLGYGTLSTDGRSLGSSGFSSAMVSDAAGEFKLDGIKPGHYAVFTARNFQQTSDSERIGSPVTVDVIDSDVDDVEIKTRPGISIDGVASLEGVTDPRLAARLANLSVYGFTMSSGSVSTPSFKSSRIQPDHTFHIGGLSPGKFNFRIMNSEAAKGFVLRRIEVNGGTLPENTIDLLEGSNVTNLRLVIGYGNCTIRGQVILPAGLPPGLMVMASALDTRRREEGSQGVQVDTRGKFVIENLSAGEYDVVVSVFPTQSNSGPTLSGKQTVTVGDGAEANVTITVAPNPPNPGGDRP